MVQKNCPSMPKDSDWMRRWGEGYDSIGWRAGQSSHIQLHDNSWGQQS